MSQSNTDLWVIRVIKQWEGCLTLTSGCLYRHARIRPQLGVSSLPTRSTSLHHSKTHAQLDDPYLTIKKPKNITSIELLNDSFHQTLGMVKRSRGVFLVQSQLLKLFPYYETERSMCNYTASLLSVLIKYIIFLNLNVALILPTDDLEKEAKWKRPITFPCMQ